MSEINPIGAGSVPLYPPRVTPPPKPLNVPQSFISFLRNPLLTIGTLLVGTAWAMGWLTLTVGHLNILSATFAMMLIGMGDYGVLWVTRYEQDRADGADVLTAMQNTAASVGPGILTAATTV